MAWAIKGTVGCTGELAFSVGAEGGKCEQFFASADHKKILVAKIGIEPIGGEVGDWPRVHLPFAGRGACSSAQTRAWQSCGQRRDGEQKLFPIHFHGRGGKCVRSAMYLILKYKTGDDATVQVRARPLVERENVPEAKPWLDRANGF